MSIEAPERARTENHEASGEQSVDDSFVRLSEGELYAPEAVRRIPETTKRETNAERAEQLGAVRLRLAEHKCDEAPKGRSEKAKSLERRAESVQTFIDHLDFHRDRARTEQMKAELANMPLQQALSTALGWARLGNAAFREKAFLRTAMTGITVGGAAFGAAVLDTALGGSFLGSGSELVASYGGLAALAAAIPTALMVRGGLKWVHAAREKRQKKAAARLLHGQGS